MAKFISKIKKASGEEVRFSEKKLRRSLGRSGADPGTIDSIVATLGNELYEGMSTREIHNRAFALLKASRETFASRYKLKRAIYELGPTGFPFEKFIGALLDHSGYRTETNRVLRGACVDHEIDVVARKNQSLTLIECKFHSEEGRNCSVRIPLYIHSRYRDIAGGPALARMEEGNLEPAWVVTNTRFTSDALAYGKCAGMYLLSWNHPSGRGLKDRIDRQQLYPITVSVLLSTQEKQFLLEREVVLGRQLLRAPYYLDHLGVSETRRDRILNEFKDLCGPKKDE